MKPSHMLAIVGLLAISIAAVTFFGDKDASILPETLINSQKASAPKACAPIDIQIDRGNSVHGIKNDMFFAYVDLATMAPHLVCHSDDIIKTALIANVTSIVDEWWEKERFQDLSAAEIHIITIFDKDEYARASFDSAQMHGLIKLSRKDGLVAYDSDSLTFDNMRSSMNK